MEAGPTATGESNRLHRVDSRAVVSLQRRHIQCRGSTDVGSGLLEDARGPDFHPRTSTAGWTSSLQRSCPDRGGERRPMRIALSRNNYEVYGRPEIWAVSR